MVRPDYDTNYKVMKLATSTIYTELKLNLLVKGNNNNTLNIFLNKKFNFSRKCQGVNPFETINFSIVTPSGKEIKMLQIFFMFERK